MALLLRDGDYVPDERGGLRTVEGAEEVLQRALFQLQVRRGSFPYGPGLGSALWDLDPAGENAGQRALALAQEALLPVPGAEALQAAWDGQAWVIQLKTPQGTGQAAVPGKESANGQL